MRYLTEALDPELVSSGRLTEGGETTEAACKAARRVGCEFLISHVCSLSYNSRPTPHTVMEPALAYVVRNSGEGAFPRSDLFERRRKLMQ